VTLLSVVLTLTLTMFERLGEIVTSGERYQEGHEGIDEPAIFTWFPKKSDYAAVPSTGLNETIENKVERVVKLARNARTEMVQLAGGDLELEERVINFFELRESLTDYSEVLRQCEPVEEQEVKEKLTKGRGILTEVMGTFKEFKLEETTEQMVVEQTFRTGLATNLVPWIDVLEKESFASLDKPTDFAHAQELEKQAVVFAKDVRKANKLLGALAASVEALPSKKMYSGQQIDDQKLRFKQIATVAATRVETTRDLLVNWNFFMETKDEAERMAETVRGMFALPALPESFTLDENDFVHGLPKVVLGFLHQAEQVVTSPPRPKDIHHSAELSTLFNQFCAVVELTSKLLERIEECTEKTPAQQEVWDQRARLKKVQSKAKEMAARQEQLGTIWLGLNFSSETDLMDFQPLVSFLHFYGECYA